MRAMESDLERVVLRYSGEANLDIRALTQYS